MKHLLAVLLALFCCMPCRAEKIHKLDLANHTGSSYFDIDDDDFSIFGFNLCYNNVNFLNPVYFAMVDKSAIEPSMGFSMSIEMRSTKFLETEVGFFSNSFKVADDQYRAALRGAELGLNFYCFPPLNAFWRHFRPYFGAGYQFSSLSLTSDSNSEFESTLKTSSMFVKGGAKLYLMGGFYVRGEYKQTMPPSSQTLFRSLNIGLGVNF